MTKDPIVKEIHQLRARMLRECDGDMNKLVARIRREAQQLGNKSVRLTPLRSKQALAGKRKAPKAR